MNLVLNVSKTVAAEPVQNQIGVRACVMKILKLQTCAVDENQAETSWWMFETEAGQHIGTEKGRRDYER